MKAIIFDFDGVIHDTRKELFAIHKQFHPKEEYQTWLLEGFSKNSRDYFDSKFSKKQQSEFEVLWTEVHKKLKIHDEMKNMLLSLKEKFKLFIITSNTENNMKIYFESNKLHHLFTQILGAETHNSKVEKFKMIFETYHLTCDDVLFITDTLGDILEANEVHVKTIAVDFGYHTREDLQKGNPYRIVSSLDEIEQIIK